MSFRYWFQRPASTTDIENLGSKHTFVKRLSAQESSSRVYPIDDQPISIVFLLSALPTITALLLTS
jgi:hypothetical protein